MRLLGDYTITYGGTAIGDTIGGVSLDFEEIYIEPKDIDSCRLIEYIVAVKGVIHKFDCEAVSLVDDLLKSSGVSTLIFTGSGHVITINNAQLLYPVSIKAGTWEHNSFDLRFFAGVDSTITAINPLFSIA